MQPLRPATPLDPLDGQIAAFEAAWSPGGGSSLARFLPPPDEPCYAELLCELICVELELRTADGQQPRVEEYLSQFAELRGQPRRLEQLCLQEWRLRSQAGEAVAVDEYRRRFGIELQPALPSGRAPSAESSAGRAAPAAWWSGLDALYQHHQASEHDARSHSAALSLLGAAREPAAPRDLLDELVGLDLAAAHLATRSPDELEKLARPLGFDLVAELGRGSFGRVFLARQLGLENRQVVLKIGVHLEIEARRLARLQHPHIVPIYSVHAAPPLTLVCMPYLGRTTLADVIRELDRHPSRLGQNAIWSTLQARRRDDTQPEPPGDLSPPAAASARQSPAGASASPLDQLDQVRAALWLTAQLAQALAHAHERGILHRDLKPANVLIADSGQPLLLDFNLAADVRTSAARRQLGGTLPYMSPEQLDEFVGGPESLDARSEVYSLGLLLAELLSGKLPGPLPAATGAALAQALLAARRQPLDLSPLRQAGIAPAVISIVQHSLAPDPAARYQSAADLAADLQCQLEDRPLRFAREGSWVEQSRKFVRRRRWALVGWAAVGLAVLALALGGYSFQRSRQLAIAQAASALTGFRSQTRQSELALSLAAPDTAEVQRGEAMCRAALAPYGLPAAGGSWRPGSAFGYLPAVDQAALRSELREQLLLLASAVALRARGEVDVARRAALVSEVRELLAQAKTVEPTAATHHSLLLEAWLAEQTGAADEAQRLRAAAQASAAEAGRGDYLAGVQHLAEGDWTGALARFQRAKQADPGNPNVWSATAACLAAQERLADAERDYGTYIAIDPDSWIGYYGRGQCRLQAGRPDEARADFAAALARRPDFAPALINQALACLQLRDWSAADQLLTQALQLVPNHTRLYFLRARARRGLGQVPQAERDQQSGMEREPGDDLSYVTRGFARLPSDPDGALADFEAALQLNPWSRAALVNQAHVLGERLNRPLESLAVHDRLLELYPDEVNARAGRGVLLARLDRRDEALRDARAALAKRGDAQTRYQAACAFAQTSRREPADLAEALRLLGLALEGGFGRDLFGADPDLAPLRSAPEFTELIKRYGVATSGDPPRK